MNPSERFKEYLSTTPTRHYGACEAQLNEAINEIDELTADLAQAKAALTVAREALGVVASPLLIDAEWHMSAVKTARAALAAMDKVKP